MLCRQTMISGCSETNATAHSFSLYASNDQLRYGAQGIDHVGKAHEKGQTGLFVVNRNQLIKRGARAESAVASRAEHHNFDVCSMAQLSDLVRQGGQHCTR